MSKTYLIPEEVNQLKEAASNPRDRLLTTVLFRFGCRISEALALTVDDFDFTRKMVTIKHLKSRTKLKCPGCKSDLSLSAVYCPKCGNKVESAVKEVKERRKQRELPLDESIISLLRQYLESGGGVVRDGKRLLFGINRHRAWQIIKNMAEKASLGSIINVETGKLHHVSPHKLRDAFAVHAVKCNDTGDGLRMLQEHLGHASFNTTAKYRKIAGEEHHKWYQELWTGGVNGPGN